MSEFQVYEVLYRGVKIGSLAARDDQGALRLARRLFRGARHLAVRPVPPEV